MAAEQPRGMFSAAEKKNGGTGRVLGSSEALRWNRTFHGPTEIPLELRLDFPFYACFCLVARAGSSKVLLHGRAPGPRKGSRPQASTLCM